MLDGVGDFTGVFQGNGEVIVCHDVIGVETQGLLVLFDRLLAVARSLQGDSQVAVRPGEIGVETQGLLVLPDRPGILPAWDSCVPRTWCASA